MTTSWRAKSGGKIVESITDKLTFYSHSSPQQAAFGCPQELEY